jgi:hypothetical protein
MIVKKNIFYTLFILNMLALVLPSLVSCSKTDTATPTNSDIQLQVMNLSPDSYPVGLYQNNLRITGTNYSFGTAPAYFYLNSTAYPLQLRISRGDSTLVFDNDSLKFNNNTRYSLFFIGLFADKTLHPLFTVDDTASLPPIGKGGKLRFVNASPRSNKLDIWANGTLAIKSTDFGKVSDYITMPAGNYSFRVYAAGTSANSLTTLDRVTIQDGRLYTLYSRGMVGRVDSASFGLVVVANNPPKINR